jgi:hypothetical protein
MPSREELHKLVDSIPDAAIDAAHQVLSRFQSWPPPPTPYGADRKIRMTETHRSVRGHELTIVESIRVEGEHLIYKHEVTGPGGKRDEREITFELTHE